MSQTATISGYYTSTQYGLVSYILTIEVNSITYIAISAGFSGSVTYNSNTYGVTLIPPSPDPGNIGNDNYFNPFATPYFSVNGLGFTANSIQFGFYSSGSDLFAYDTFTPQDLNAVNTVTEVTNCFLEGTMIETENRKYIEVENIRKGVKIMTYGTFDDVEDDNGTLREVIWIGKQKSGTNLPQPPVVIFKDYNAGFSMGHRVRYNYVIKHAENHVNDENVVTEERENPTYYHFEFEKHYMVNAGKSDNKLLAESFLNCGNKGKFEEIL